MRVKLYRLVANFPIAVSLLVQHYRSDPRTNCYNPIDYKHRRRKVPKSVWAMASAAARAYNGGLGAEPPAGIQGAEPPVGGQGASPP